MKEMESMSSRKQPISIWLSQEVLDMLARCKAAEMRSRSFITERALRIYFGLAISGSTDMGQIRKDNDFKT